MVARLTAWLGAVGGQGVDETPRSPRVARRDEVGQKVSEMPSLTRRNLGQTYRDISVGLPAGEWQVRAVVR